MNEASGIDTWGERASGPRHWTARHSKPIIFLRDWGTSLAAGLVIPATVSLTFIALRLLGESFNLMTLGGLAAAVGLVIDDAIVVVENIIMHRDSGQSRSEAVRSALSEITAPLVGSFYCYRALGSDLLPGMDEGGFVIDYWMPAGSSLDETNRVLSSIESMLHSIPEVASTSRRTGLPLKTA
jgi:multidrug efflux pump subunit AcrB